MDIFGKLGLVQGLVNFASDGCQSHLRDSCFVILWVMFLRNDPKRNECQSSIMAKNSSRSVAENVVLWCMAIRYVAFQW